MSDWVEILRGFLSEVTPAQSWLQANGIPTFVRDTSPEMGIKSLLVTRQHAAKARQLMASLSTMAELSEHGEMEEERYE